VVQETRHFHEDNGRTTPGRSKEEATDYRYFPEPDLVPVAPDAAWVDRLRSTLPELPAERRARLAGELGATDFEMESMANAGVVELVAATAGAGAPAAEARNWWLGYLTQKANAAEVEPADLAITPAQVARVVALVEDGTLSVGLARQAVDGVLETGADVDAVVAERGLRRVSDVDALAAAVDAAIAAAPDVADKIRGGKVAAAGALVGAVMKATRGQADAKTVRELILQKLS
jgi:aspartyl-tRNA(Asn)/glutamyl-tRNA(Gln) amidotransferase subunit B